MSIEIELLDHKLEIQAIIDEMEMLERCSLTLINELHEGEGQD